MKKNKGKLKIKSFPAVIYAILAGPIELLLIYFIFGIGKYSTNLFKLLGFIILFSFLYELFPFIIKLLFRLFKIDIFDSIDEEDIAVYAPVSYLVSWFILFIFVDMGTKTLFGRIFSIIALTFLIGGFNLIGSGIFTKIRHPGIGVKPEEKDPNKEKKDKLEFKYKEYYKDGQYLGDSRTMSYGNLSETTITDKFGNVVGEINSVEFGKKNK